MKTLISMTAFVKQKAKELFPINRTNEFAMRVNDYAKFLSRTTEIWQFVPCKLIDGVWVVLEEPLMMSDYDMVKEIAELDTTDKERCYFEGVTVVKDNYYETKRTFYFIGKLRIALNLEYHTGETEFNFSLGLNHKTLEDLVPYNLTLTDTAIKEFEL